MTTSSLATLLGQLASSDKDHRYMATSDLLSEVSRPDWRAPSNEHECAQLCTKLVDQLEDASGDISALAVKCLAALVNKVQSQFITRILDQLCQRIIRDRKRDRNSDAACIALKAIVTDLASERGTLVTSTCIPILVDGLTKKDDPDIRLDCLDAVHVIVLHFGGHIQNQAYLMDLFLTEIQDPRLGMMKKSLACIPVLAVHMNDELVSNLVSSLVTKLESPETSEPLAQAYMQALGACSKSLGFRFGPHVGRVVPVAMQRCTGASDEVCELKEAALQALSCMVQFCSEDVKGHANVICDLAIAHLSFDPNYADDDDDEEMAGDDDDDGDDEDAYDDDDDDLEVDYADDEDVSWKVRRMSARCLAALSSAYPDQVDSLYKKCQPALVARFKEREDSVKLDIFETFCHIARIAAGRHAALLQADAEATSAALVKHLKTKNMAVKSGVFQTLIAVVSGAGVTAGQAPIVLTPALACLADGASTNPLKIDVLKLLKLLVTRERAAGVLPHVGRLLEVLKECLEDRYYRVVSEALGACENVAAVLACADGDVSAHTSALFEQVLARLKATDQDQEVKELAIRAIAFIVYQLSHQLADKGSQYVVPILLDRLGTETTRLPAVKAFGVIGTSENPVSFGHNLEAIFNTMASFLRKVHRFLRQATLATLIVLLNRYGEEAHRLGVVESVLAEGKALVNDADLLLAAGVLQTAVAALKAHRGVSSSPPMAPLTEAAMKLSTSTLLRGTAQDALKDYLCTVCDSGSPGMGFEQLRETLLRLGTNAPRGAQRSVAECVAALCREHPARVKSTLQLCVRHLEDQKTSEAVQCITLLVIGEVGRVSDLTAYPEVANFVTAALANGTEDVKATASLALGCVAVGNLGEYLPFLLSSIAEQQSSGSQKQLYLLLKALNEVLRTLPSRGQQLQADHQQQVVNLLLNNAQVEDECRNMVSDCFAQLAFMAPHDVMPLLQSSLAHDAPETRGVAVAALRCMLGDSSRSVDVSLSNQLSDFLRRLEDPDHTVRKQAVQLVSVCVHTHPEVLVPCLPRAQASLLMLTTKDQSLIQEVELGPFKETRDSGLSLRKHTFECLEALLARPIFLDCLDLSGFAGTLVTGLEDDKDIKRTCNTILTQLCSLAPSHVLAILEKIIPPLQKTLGAPIKDDAIPQVKERHEELLKSTLAAINAVHEIPQATSMVPPFKAFINTKVVGNPKIKPLWDNVMKQQQF